MIEFLNSFETIKLCTKQEHYISLLIPRGLHSNTRVTYSFSDIACAVGTIIKSFQKVE